MTRIRRGWQPALSLVLVLVGAIGLVTLSGVGQLNGQGPGNSGKSKTKSTAPAASDPELDKDLDDAIKVVEKGEFRVFLVKYAPVEMLRHLRQQELFDRAVTVLSGQPKAKEQLLAILNALRKQTPTYDKSRGFATIQYDPRESGVEEVEGELHLPNTDNLELVGLGDDLNKVMAEATRLLGAGEFQTFVERLFPASELARLKELDAMPDLLQQFRNSTSGAKQSKPAPPRKPTPQQKQEPVSLVQAFQADFARLQAMTPELTDDGRVAVYQLESQNQQPPRVIKFQKTGSDWRFFDDAERVITELTRQSKEKPRSAVSKVQMELIGGNWRFVELHSLRLVGK